MKANGHLLPIPDFRLLLTLTPSAKTTHSPIFYMLPFCLVLLIPFAYSHAAKNRSLIKSPPCMEKPNPLSGGVSSLCVTRNEIWPVSIEAVGLIGTPLIE